MLFRDLLTTTLLLTTRKGVPRNYVSTKLEDDIEYFISLFEGSEKPVYIGGGIAMSVHVGHIFREHKDFDIMVFVEDFPSIVEHLSRKGYEVVTRTFLTHISKNFNIQCVAPIDPKDVDMKNPGKMHIKILKKNSHTIRGKMKRTDFFEIFFLQRYDDGVHLVNNNNFVPWEDWYPARKISDKSNLLLPNIQYRKYSPPKSENQIKDYEMAGILYTN